MGVEAKGVCGKQHSPTIALRPLAQVPCSANPYVVRSWWCGESDNGRSVGQAATAAQIDGRRTYMYFVPLTTALVVKKERHTRVLYPVLEYRSYWCDCTKGTMVDFLWRTAGQLPPCAVGSVRARAPNCNRRNGLSSWWWRMNVAILSII